MAAFYIKDGEMYSAEEYEASNTVVTADNVVVSSPTPAKPIAPSQTTDNSGE